MSVRWNAIRLAAVALLVGLVLGIVVPKIFAADPSQSHLQKIHVVKAGESLWALARESNAQKDPRRFVYEVQVLNGLKGAQLSPGQKLILP
ncbi:MAG: LysM peptidoglycan-binding domain-containing protein [Actinomycetota bacterium]